MKQMTEKPITKIPAPMPTGRGIMAARVPRPASEGKNDTQVSDRNRGRGTTTTVKLGQRKEMVHMGLCT